MGEARTSDTHEGTVLVVYVGIGRGKSGGLSARSKEPFSSIRDL